MPGTGTGNKIRGIEQEYPVSAKASLNPSLLVNAAIQGLKRGEQGRGRRDIMVGEKRRGKK